MVSAAQAEELRAAQTGIRALVEERMERIVDYLASQPNLTAEQFRNSLISQTNLVVSRYGDSAAAVAAEWYDSVRAAEQVAGRYRAITATSPYGSGAVDGMVRRAIGPLFDETPDLAAVMRTVAQNAGKYVLGASRETIRVNSFRDPSADGWRRVARGETCDFCLMLVGRGGVYKQETAFFASHGDCDCGAAPSFDPSAPEVDARLYEASRRTTGMTPAQRAAHNDLIRTYIADNKTELAELRASL